MMKNSKKVFVALSGGVDSSVAAYILKQQGYDVRGIFMREFDYADIDTDASTLLSCAQEEDRISAQKVAEHLHIPFEAWDFRKEYYDHVVKYLFSGYARGITPNPDIMCNAYVKFGVFLDRALREGADAIATGHYVRKKVRWMRWPHRQKWEVHRAKDANKDQSYFLYPLTQNQLERSFFPLGNLLKSQVRVIAQKAGLPNWERKDSQGICFVGKVPMKDFLQSTMPAHKGELYTRDGVQVGEHDGAEYYTIGQRHGLGFGGGAEPYYVVGKDIEKNIVYVGHVDDPALYAKELNCNEVHWIGRAPHLHESLLARIRYRQSLQRCRILPSDESGVSRVIFDSPQRAVTPGQAIVFYRGGVMLGGGTIVAASVVGTFQR